MFTELFIFEIANNHQGDVRHGLRIIAAVGQIARKHAIRGGVKFQYRDLDTFIHPEYKTRSDVKHIARFLRTSLTEQEFCALRDAVRAERLIAICTPFDEVSVKKCGEHGFDILKVGSCSADDWPLLEAVADAGKPVIVSTGGLTLQSTDKVVNFLTHRAVRFALMHCVGIYPTPPEQLQLNVISRLRRRYPFIPVGYSGHEVPTDVSVVQIAVAKGATLLERHVGIPIEHEPLNQYSMDPAETERWVEAALRAKSMCGDERDKTVSQEETQSLMSLRRGVYARGTIPSGRAIRREDVYFAMPCREGQSTSSEFGRYTASFVASRDYEADEAICETSPEDLVARVRSVIHEAKAMLFEAQIALGPEPEVELSHHYGMESFREYGAIIVNGVNREYCKKLLIMLPGQKHPNHYHNQKEETFELLWGHLEITVSGETTTMVPGGRVLVPRAARHSFRSVSGAIIEEISTTHRKGDSLYEDERIRTLDPIRRKTVLDSW